MGLKGNLSTVNLADVFQVLSRGNSTGLLRIQAPEGPRFVEIQNGTISIAGRSAGRILLGDLLLSRGLLDEARLESALQVQRETNKLLGQVLMEQQLVPLESLQEALRFQVEEEVCELFTLGKGEFDFLAGAALDAKIAPGGGLVKLNIDPNSLLLEAARRADEWKAIEKRVPNQGFLFRLTAQGAEVLKSGAGLSPEGMVLLKLVEDNRSVEAMVQKACMGRLNTNQMLLELWDAGIVEPLPMENYEAVARAHLKQNRVEEAQRIAEYANLGGQGGMGSKLQAAMAEIEKAKKAAISGTMTATADPKIRSEVIRRNQPGLILKKERNFLPLIIGAVVLILAGGGAAVYFKYFATNKVDTTQRKLLNEQLSQVQDAMAAQQYSKALELLRTFRSKDPETQTIATEQYEAHRKDVELLLAKAINNFTTAYAKGPPEALRTAADELEKFNGIQSLTDASLAELEKTKSLLKQVKNHEKLEATRARLREVDSTAKTKTADALKKSYEELLAENPPEEVSAEVRDKLGKLSRARAEAERRLQLAAQERDVGETESAKAQFDAVKHDGPGTDYVAKGTAGFDAIDKYVAECQKKLDKVEILLTQKQTDAARKELLSFIESRPPDRLFNSALDSLHTLDTAPETELEAALKEAKEVSLRLPDEGRKKIIALLEKAPYSKTASTIVFKLPVKSEPPGADVFFNGRPFGKTPATVEVPALGVAHFSIKKPGFQPEDVIDFNFRKEMINLTLRKLPSTVRALPAPAAGGLVATSDYIFALSAGEAIVCAPNDLKVVNRVPLHEGDEQKTDASLQNGRALMVAQDTLYAVLDNKALGRIKLPGGEYSRMALAKTATSLPIVYSSKELPGKQLVALAEGGAFECLFTEDGKVNKSVAGKEPAATVWGLALDGEMFFVPQQDLFVAILGHSGEKKWEAPIEGQLAAGPVIASARSTIGVVSGTGQLLGFDTDGGTKRFQRDLGGKPSPFLISTSGAFLTALKDGKMELSAADKGAALWTAELKGEPTVCPVAVRSNDKEPEKAFAFCTRAGEANVLTVLAASNGAVLWSARLLSNPVALMSVGEKIYVATVDGEIAVYDLN
jgi:outer membrane protein assembly factor BamB